MLKIKKTALVALTVGAVMLTTAAVANFATSNGYNIYKESIRKLFEQDNYTADFSLSVSVDDEELARGSLSEQYDKANNSYVKKETSFDKTRKVGQEWISEHYYNDGQYISRSNPDFIDGKYVYNDAYEVNDFYKSHLPNPILSKYSFISSRDEEELFDKYYNFASSCADLFVGDIKNNFVITSAQDGLSTYEANLDLFQIPEIVNAGTDLVVSQLDMDYSDDTDSSGDDFGDYIKKFAVEPFVSGAKCTFTVDDEGRLINNVLTGEISGKDLSGEVHTMKFVFEIACGNYGTTVPEKIDLDKVKHISESQTKKERLAELEMILNGNLKDSDRERYEDEYNNLKARLEYFEQNGMIDYDEISFETKQNGEINVVYRANDNTEEKEEVIMSEGVEILD